VRGVVAAVVDYVRRMLAGIGASLMPHRVVHGIELIQYFREGESADLFDKLAEAIEIIRIHDPKRFARLPGQLPRIALVDKGGEVFDHGLKAYIANAETVRARSAGEVALAIVHEATHARFYQFGVRTTPSNLDRMECACILQEIAFAEITPLSDELVPIARGKLGRPWWGGREGRRRMDAMARSLGVPSIVIRLRNWLLDSH